MNFLAKNQKTLNVGKIRKYDEERAFFFAKKKRFHLSKAFFYQNWKAQNMWLVAGSLVQVFTSNVKPNNFQTNQRRSAKIQNPKSSSKSDWENASIPRKILFSVEVNLLRDVVNCPLLTFLITLFNLEPNNTTGKKIIFCQASIRPGSSSDMCLEKILQVAKTQANTSMILRNVS